VQAIERPHPRPAHESRRLFDHWDGDVVEKADGLVGAFIVDLELDNQSVHS
jgi:hypothetical protein